MGLRNQLPGIHPLAAPVHPPERGTGPLGYTTQKGSTTEQMSSYPIRLAVREYALQFDNAFSRLLIRLRPLICPFEELLEAVPFERSILDIGCGTGLWLYLIVRFKKPKCVSGVDSSYTRIKETQDAFSALGKSVSLITASSPSLWPSRSFSVVSMIDVLHHIPPESQESFFLSAALRVAKGGCLIYKDMCVRPAWRRVANNLHDLIVARQWIHHVDVKKVESWATNSGLILKTKSNIPLYWYGHELRCFVRPDQ